MIEYLDLLNLYKSEKLIEVTNFTKQTLTILTYDTLPSGFNWNIKTILPTISVEYFGKLEVSKCNLCINIQNECELKIARSLDIDVNPYIIDDVGVLLSLDGNLLLMDK